MKWIAIGAIFLSLAGSVHAAGSDEQYLDVYNEILQGDSLSDGGRPEAAASRYLQAQKDLAQLQSEHPTWNPDVVKFRLDYLAEKLHGLQKFLPKTNAVPSAPTAQEVPATNSALADAQATISALQQQTAAYQQQIRTLNEDNNELQGKLKEALTVQPAAVSPEQVARDQTRILSLEKERDLLSVALAQEKAARAEAGSAVTAVDAANKNIAELKAHFAAELKKSRLEMIAAKEAAEQSEKKFIAANKELQELKSSAAAKATQDAAWKAAMEADQKQAREEVARLREAKAESDKIIADANKELEGLRAKHGPEIHPASETNAISEQHDQLKQLVAEVARDESEISQLKDMVAESDKKLTAANQELKSVEAARKAASRDVAGIATIAAERDKLRSELALRSKDLADAEAHHNQELNGLRTALREAQDRQEELMKNLEVQAQPPPAPAPSNPASTLQMERLEARVAVLEAEPIPYTKEELALLKKPRTLVALRLAAADPPAEADSPATHGAPTNAAASQMKPRHVYTVMDLPPGSGAIWKQAVGAAMEGDYASAEKGFKEVLRQDENNVYVLAHLGNAQFSLGELADCEKTVQHALAIDSADPGSLFLMGLLRYRQNRLDEALDALSLSARYNPTNTTTQNFLGCVLADKGLRRAAETAFRKALLGDPNYADAHFNLAVIYAGDKPPERELARWHYKRAVALGHVPSEKVEKMFAGESDGTVPKSPGNNK